MAVLIHGFAAFDDIRSIPAFRVAPLPVQGSTMKTRQRYNSVPLFLLISALFVSAGAALRADDLPAVGTAAPGFTLNSQEWAVIVGISVDSLESHQQFCTKESLTFRLLSDVDHTVTSAYGSLTHFGETVMAARNTFLIDPKGVVRKIYTKVNPGRHSGDVLAALTDLQQHH